MSHENERYDLVERSTSKYYPFARVAPVLVRPGREDWEAAMDPFMMTIAGEFRSGKGASFPVVNPATGETFARAPECSREDLDMALDSADSALRDWARDESRRRQALVAMADALRTMADELAPLLTAEQGKPLQQAKLEIWAASAVFRHTASLELPVDVIKHEGKSRIEIHRRPLGVVGAIAPWNYPVLIAAAKLAPALLAGNTVVLKPSPYTPLTTLRLGETLRRVFPRGVVNVISGGDGLGAWLTEHPAVRKISFTGSVATGKKVSAAAAADLKRVTLELGGNDPAIVLADVDPAKVGPALFWGAFTNSGQVCTAIKRLYVEEPVFEAVALQLATLAATVKLGNGLDPDVQLGPINNAPQHRRVAELVDDAKARGARVRAGGHPRPGAGYFFEPTILTDVGDETRIVSEEQFGPALPVLPFTRLDDALERANTTHFGLSASVWTSDRDKGAAVAAELECGTAWVNQHIALSSDAPFGGSKWSGIGYENGRWGLDSFCQLQVINIR
jgi:acyl-CoA reductase-like NAD-dependent aldehyde dehydrogenase